MKTERNWWVLDSLLVCYGIPVYVRNRYSMEAVLARQLPKQTYLLILDTCIYTYTY